MFKDGRPAPSAAAAIPVATVPDRPTWRMPPPPLSLPLVEQPRRFLKHGDAVAVLVRCGDNRLRSTR